MAMAMPMFFEILFKESLNDFIPGAGLGGDSFPEHEPDLDLLLLIVEDIMKWTVSSTPEISCKQEPNSSLKTEENRTRIAVVMQRYASTITITSRELTGKSGEKEYEKTVNLMKTLSTYSWKTMVTMAVAAFAIKYGKLRLFKLFYATNPLARTVALLKQQPDVPEYTQHLKSWFDTLANLINKTLELAKLIVQYKERAQQNTSERGDVKKIDYTLPTAAYWTVNSTVVCSSQIMNVLVMRKCNYTDLAAFKVNLDNVTEKLCSMVERISSQPQLPPEESANKLALHRGPTEDTISMKCLQKLCLVRTPEVTTENLSLPYKSVSSEPESHLLSYNLKDETGYVEAYQGLVSLFAQKDQPLFDGSTKTRVSIDVLKAKGLLLFISDLDLSREELLKLDQVFMYCRQQTDNIENHYEIIWIPVIENSMSRQDIIHHFETIKSWMPCYSFYHPFMINPLIIKYIKEVWKFNGKPLVVVLDSQGNVLNHNAIHMIRIWGSRAIPFTKQREQILWKEETWRAELLVDSIDPLISDWIREGKYICMYGGEDKEWTRRFTTTALEIARAENIQLEMVYTGHDSTNDIVEIHTNTLVSQTLIESFWLRLESIVQSRESLTNYGKVDMLLEELKAILALNKNKKSSWALIFQKDSMKVAKANGEDFLKCFLEYDQWKEDAEDEGFLPAMSLYLQKLQSTRSNFQLMLTQKSNRSPSRTSSSFYWKSLFCFADTPTN